jgi:hypothetical protein
LDYFLMILSDRSERFFSLTNYNSIDRLRSPEEQRPYHTKTIVPQMKNDRFYN